MLALNSALLAMLVFCLFSEADRAATITARFGMETWGMLFLGVTVSYVLRSAPF